MRKAAAIFYRKLNSKVWISLLLLGCGRDPAQPPLDCAPFSGRFRAAAAFDERRATTLIFGGFDGSGSLATTTYAWDGSTLHCLATDGPSGREAPLMTYDAARGVIVLFGGREPSLGVPGMFRDTWEWNGVRWQLVDTLGPPPRLTGVMGYDRRTQRVIMTGGFFPGADSIARDTWSWDGSRWTQEAQMFAPDQAVLGTAYDDARDALVLLALNLRRAESQRWEARSWLWRNEWTIESTSYPMMTSPASFFIDRRGNYIVYNGATSLPDTASITWIGRDGAWQQIRTSPPRRTGQAYAYDRARDRAVLIGGISGGILDDIWEWNGVRWERKR